MMVPAGTESGVSGASSAESTSVNPDRKGAALQIQGRGRTPPLIRLPETNAFAQPCVSWQPPFGGGFSVGVGLK